MVVMIGIVVIGRNEGNRLQDCLECTMYKNYPVIYVDSCSEDNSLDIARQFNIEIVELSLEPPLSAARGRNAGAKRLLELHPNLQYIQFIDGDTVLEKGWLLTAASCLHERQDVAIITGQLKEYNHNISVYKELSALEWKRKPGIITSCGGNMMMRTDAFCKLGGFNPAIIGGEDTELCYRVRQAGWKILCIDTAMATHDSKIYTLNDFCNRCIRTGYGYQQISSLYAHENEKLFLRENISNWIYGGILPIAMLVLLPLTSGWSLLFLLAYPILAARIYFRTPEQWKSRLAFAYAITCVISKFPGFYGACKYILKKI